MLDDFSGVEGHGQALAGTLGMPDDPGSFVALGRNSGEGGGDRLVHRMILVIACHFFGDAIAIHFKDNEITDQVEEMEGVKDIPNQNFEIRRVGREGRKGR